MTRKRTRDGRESKQVSAPSRCGPFRPWRRIRVRASWVLMALWLAGCGLDEGFPDRPEAGAVILTGEVLEVRDLVPVDGGVTILITVDGGQAEHLLFPSLFTHPSPSGEILALYEVVSQVEVGDRVRAGGRRTTVGLELETLTILAE